MEYSKQKPDTIIFPLVDEISRVLDKPVVTSKYFIGADEFELRPGRFRDAAKGAGAANYNGSIDLLMEILLCQVSALNIPFYDPLNSSGILAHSRFAPSKLAPDKSAPDRSASLKLASLKFASVR